MHKLKPQTENKTANTAEQQFSLRSRASLNTFVNRSQCFHSGLYRATCLKPVTLKAQKSTETSLSTCPHTPVYGHTHHLCACVLLVATNTWHSLHNRTNLSVITDCCIHLSRLKPQNPSVLVPTPSSLFCVTQKDPCWLLKHNFTLKPKALKKIQCDDSSRKQTHRWKLWAMCLAHQCSGRPLAL